ncbi:hypothetical protein BH11ARM2_BH11ARM2_23830 [soil metagenome]
MKGGSIPTPVIAGVLVVVVAIAAFFFIRGVSEEPRTPRPDPALFGGKPKGPPDESVSGAQTPLNSTTGR